MSLFLKFLLDFLDVADKLVSVLTGLIALYGLWKQSQETRKNHRK